MICFYVQVKPIQFTVQAVVTYSDLQFDLSEVDFGYCPINQSVKSRVHLTNLSLLPQDFGFVGVQEVLHEPVMYSLQMTFAMRSHNLKYIAKS